MSENIFSMSVIYLHFSHSKFSLFLWFYWVRFKIWLAKGPILEWAAWTATSTKSKSLMYQLDSCVKLLPTLVAKWLEHWQICSVSLRAAFVFGQKLESDYGWIAVCTNEWCYKYIHMQIPVLVVEQTRSKFRLAPTPGLTPTGTMLQYRSTPC